MKKMPSVRRTEIPVGYVIDDPNGNRASRRLAAKKAKAARRGRTTGLSTGAAPLHPTIHKGD